MLAERVGLESEAKASHGGPKISAANDCWGLKSIKVKILTTFFILTNFPDAIELG